MVEAKTRSGYYVAAVVCISVALVAGLLIGTDAGISILGPVGAIVVFLFLVWDIRLLVPLLIVTLPFGPKFSMSFGNLYLSTAITIVGYIALAVRTTLVRDAMSLRYNRVTLSVIGLMGAFILSTLQNYEVLLSDISAFLKFMQFLLSTGLFVLVSQIQFSRAEVKGLLAFALLVGVAQGVVGAAQWITRPGMYVLGTFGQHNLFAIYEAFIVILLVGVLLETKRAVVRIACIAGIGIGLYAIAFSFSRTAYVSLFVSLLVFAVLPIGRLKRMLVPATALAAGALAFATLPSAVMERARNILETATGQYIALSFRYRLRMWRIAFEDFSESPLFGKGAWAFGLRDNFFMKAMAETGILGIGAFLILILTILHASWRNIKSPPRDDFMRGVVVGFFPAAVGNLIVFNLAGDFMSIHTSMGVFWIVLALLIQYCSASESGPDGIEKTAQGPVR